MRKNSCILPMLLTGLLTVYLLAVVILRALMPWVIFPLLDLPMLVLFSLAALLGEHYLAPEAEHHYLCLALLGAVSFGVLPAVAGFAGWQQALLLAGLGGTVFALTAAVFASIRRRLASGPKAPLAPVVCALCLYLAAQALHGVLL